MAVIVMVVTVMVVMMPTIGADALDMVVMALLWCADIPFEA